MPTVNLCLEETQQSMSVSHKSVGFRYLGQRKLELEKDHGIYNEAGGPWYSVGTMNAIQTVPQCMRDSGNLSIFHCLLAMSKAYCGKRAQVTTPSHQITHQVLHLQENLLLSAHNATLLICLKVFLTSGPNWKLYQKYQTWENLKT